MLALYWPKMGPDWKPKVCTIVSLVMILIIAIMMMVSQATLYNKYTKTVNLAYPDIIGTVGGFIFGVTSAFILLPTDKVKTKAEKAMFAVGCAVTPSLALALFLAFFLAQTPDTEWYIQNTLN